MATEVTSIVGKPHDEDIGPTCTRMEDIMLTTRMRLFSLYVCMAILLRLHTQVEPGANSRSPPAFTTTTSIYLHRHSPRVQSLFYQVAQLRTIGVHCRESTGTGLVVLKVVRVTTGVAYPGDTVDQVIHTFFFSRRPLLPAQWTCAMHPVSEAAVRVCHLTSLS